MGQLLLIEVRLLQHPVHPIAGALEGVLVNPRGETLVAQGRLHLDQGHRDLALVPRVLAHLAVGNEQLELLEEVAHLAESILYRKPGRGLDL